MDIEQELLLDDLEASLAKDGYVDIDDGKFNGELLPKLAKACQLGDVDSFLSLYGPYSLLELVRLARTTKLDNVKATVLLALKDACLGKAVQRSFNINKNINTMGEKEIDALLRSELKKLSPAERQDLLNAGPTT